jgi:hypothetical protein
MLEDDRLPRARFLFGVGRMSSKPDGDSMCLILRWSNKRDKAYHGHSFQDQELCLSQSIPKYPNMGEEKCGHAKPSLASAKLFYQSTRYPLLLLFFISSI